MNGTSTSLSARCAPQSPRRKTQTSQKDRPTRLYELRPNAPIDALIEAATNKLNSDPQCTRALFIRATSLQKKGDLYAVSSA